MFPPRNRILVLPIAAAVIAGLCAYKLSRHYEPHGGVPGAVPVERRRAPLDFELYDQHSQLVKFERYAGRHRILIVFYDGGLGVERDPLLLLVRENYDKLKASGIVVAGISRVLPQENRLAAAQTGGVAFPLLTDLDPQQQTSGDVHRRWGRWDEQTGRALPGCFLVERDGTVAWSSGKPRPIADPATAIAEMGGH